MDWIKSNPWTMAIVAVVGLGAVVGVIYALATHKARVAAQDKGFMADRRWPLVDLPVAVWFAPGLPETLQQAWEVAAATWEKAVGRELFMRGIPAPAELDLDKLPQGNVVLRTSEATGAMQADHGSTELVEDPHRVLTFKCARVTLPWPLAAQLQKPMCLHEQGHLFDLAHDERRDSIMYPTLQALGTVSEADADRVRAVTQPIKEV